MSDIRCQTVLCPMSDIGYRISLNRKSKIKNRKSKACKPTIKGLHAFLIDFFVIFEPEQQRGGDGAVDLSGSKVKNNS